MKAAGSDFFAPLFYVDQQGKVIHAEPIENAALSQLELLKSFGDTVPCERTEGTRASALAINTHAFIAADQNHPQVLTQAELEKAREFVDEWTEDYQCSFFCDNVSEESLLALADESHIKAMQAAQTRFAKTSAFVNQLAQAQGCWGAKIETQENKSGLLAATYQLVTERGVFQEDEELGLSTYTENPHVMDWNLLSSAVYLQITKPNHAGTLAEFAEIIDATPASLQDGENGVELKAWKLGQDENGKDYLVEQATLTDRAKLTKALNGYFESVCQPADQAEELRVIEDEDENGDEEEFDRRKIIIFVPESDFDQLRDCMEDEDTES